MYNEEQYIYETFMKNFIRNKRGSVVLYGTGIHTAKLLEKVERGQIAGLMDVKRTGEVLWGYQVLSYEEVRRIPDVCIVILARDAVINTVYRRIEDFCRDNKIRVFDIHGNHLASNRLHEEEHRCFLLERGELLEKIEKADMVTFDIFDTLLTRKILSPQDVFRYMDDIDLIPNLKYSDPIRNFKFSYERKKAEDEIRDKKNPTIYDIYDRLKKNTGIKESEKESLLEWETETESRMLCRREAICRMLDYARELGKNVCLVSDMYLTGEQIRRILTAHQITGYDRIFVSCDYLAGKQDGLFQIVRKELDPGHSARILHIGDHYFSDIRAADEAGFDTYQVYSPREMYERSIYSSVLPEPESMEEELVLGKFISMAFNNPFGKYKGNGKLIFDDAGKAAELLIAPVILKYMLFLIQTVAEKQIDFIIFPSRDGYLLRRLFDLIKESGRSSVRLPESIYFYTSRRAALTASAYTEQDVVNILTIDDTRKPVQMLRARFGIKIDEGLWVDGEGHRQKEIPPKIMERLLRLCEEERKSYRKYLASLRISDYRLPAFVDFIAVGTVQLAIEKLAGKKMQGVYFWKRRSSEERYENLDVSSLYRSAGDFDMDANIYRFYYFLENILSSKEPSFTSVTDEGNFCFYEEKRTGEDIERLDRIHRSVEEYIKDMIRILPKPENCGASLRLYDAILGLLSKEYSEFDEEALFHMKNVDEFMGRSVTSMNR